MSAPLIRIATRESPLALWQAEYVKARLLAAHPALQVELVPMTTRGDQILTSPLSQIGGKGLFTREIEEALLAGSIDIAVHSMKDMPTLQPEGLVLDCYLPREDVRDAFVSPGVGRLMDLPQGAVVLGGTDACPVGSFAIPGRVMTTQYHPEMSHGFISDLVEEYADDLPADEVAFLPMPHHLRAAHAACQRSIVEQDVIRVDHSDTPEDMVQLGKDIEKVVLARGLRAVVEDRVLLAGHKTVVFR